MVVAKLVAMPLQTLENLVATHALFLSSSERDANKVLVGTAEINGDVRLASSHRRTVVVIRHSGADVYRVAETGEGGEPEVGQGQRDGEDEVLDPRAQRWLQRGGTACARRTFRRGRESART